MQPIPWNQTYITNIYMKYFIDKGSMKYNPVTERSGKNNSGEADETEEVSFYTYSNTLFSIIEHLYFHIVTQFLILYMCYQKGIYICVLKWQVCVTCWYGKKGKNHQFWNVFTVTHIHVVSQIWEQSFLFCFSTDLFKKIYSTRLEPRGIREFSARPFKFDIIF